MLDWLLFLATSVIMARIQAEPIGEREYLVEDWFIQGVRVPLLEIGPTAASDQ